MRSLLTDEKLINLVDEIEKHLGSISVGQMSEEQNEIARCSMAYSSDAGWTLLTSARDSLTPPTICHELAHLVLVIEGWPIFSVHDSIPHRTPEYEVLKMLSNLIQHIDVWDIVRGCGFDETTDYTPGLEQLIMDIEGNNMFNSCRPELITSFRAAYIAQALLGPSTETLINRLESSASRTMPEALSLAQNVVNIFNRYKPLDPQKCIECFTEVLYALNLAHRFLTLHTTTTIESNFRSRFIQ
ncbi:TPA: hypothetical protein ACU15Y_002577 [Escherichia coli]|uniref:hypothetical protein n=1 Tax=Escherichia coli TaxID=562 RepID=UPI001ADB5D41|nr:hypothetical protein [Escherichia coli]MBO9280175.1 hypothetical protein [Escherichia coli]MBO9293014.1 hypothetical protein [Escherichia coli]